MYSSTDIVALALNTPGGGASAIGTYSLDANSVAESALFEHTTDAFWCIGTAGSATVTADGGVGGRIIGTYTVTAWVPLVSGTCPAAPSGSFSVTREPDDLMGNDGTQFDTFSMGAVVFTENATTLYDPLVSLVIYPHSDGSTGSLYMDLDSGASLATGKYSNKIDFSVNNIDVTLPTGTYDNATTGVAMYLTVDGHSCFLSGTASNTTVTITKTAAIGAKVEGTYNFQGITGTGCPVSTLTGTFAVTRESPD